MWCAGSYATFRAKFHEMAMLPATTTDGPLFLTPLPWWSEIGPWPQRGRVSQSKGSGRGNLQNTPSLPSPSKKGEGS